MDDYKVCKNCGHEFIPKTKNQKYCDKACCRIATNRKIMEKYYEKKRRLVGIKRYCECGSQLSIYNVDSHCYVCLESKKDSKVDKRLREALANVAKRAEKK